MSKISEDEMDAMMESGFTGKEPELPAAPAVEEPVVPTEHELPAAPAVEEPEVPAAAEPAVTPEPERDVIGERFKTLEETIYKMRDTFHGRIGSIEDRIKKHATALSPKAKENLTNDYPDLAKLLFGDSEEEHPARPQSATDGEQPPARPQSATTEEPEFTTEQLVELRLLKRDHPDWEKVVHATEFVNFMKTQSKGDQYYFNNSWDADFVSSMISKFKETSKKEPEPPPSGPTSEKMERQKRLEAALTPSGDKRKTDLKTTDEEAAMEAAFNSQL